MFHDKSKHIKIKFHYIMDMVHRGALKLQYVAIEEHIANVLTKHLARVKFEYFQRKTWCDLDRDPSKEGVMCSSIARETGCLSVTS